MIEKIRKSNKIRRKLKGKKYKKRNRNSGYNISFLELTVWLSIGVAMVVSLLQVVF